MFLVRLGCKQRLRQSFTIVNLPNVPKLHQFCYCLLLQRCFKWANVWILVSDRIDSAYVNFIFLILDRRSHSFFHKKRQYIVMTAEKLERWAGVRLTAFNSAHTMSPCFALSLSSPKVGSMSCTYLGRVMKALQDESTMFDLRQHIFPIIMWVGTSTVIEKWATIVSL